MFKSVINFVARWLGRAMLLSLLLIISVFGFSGTSQADRLSVPNIALFNQPLVAEADTAPQVIPAPEESTEVTAEEAAEAQEKAEKKAAKEAKKLAKAEEKKAKEAAKAEKKKAKEAAKAEEKKAKEAAKAEKGKAKAAEEAPSDANS